jgi:hypothetical protein
MIQIVYVMDFSSGGIGDMLRFMMSAFAFTQEKPGSRFLINTTKRIDLERYFDIDEEYRCRKPLEEIQDKIRFLFQLQEVRDIILSLRDNDVIYITSNAFGFVSPDHVHKHAMEFRTRVLRPTALTEKKIQDQLLTIYGAGPNHTFKYICLHVRCGDYVITNMPRNGTEKRLNIWDEQTIQLILEQASNAINRFDTNDNVLFFIHSDSLLMKTRLVALSPKCVPYPSTICHIAEEEPVAGGYLSTIAEFFTITRATQIVQLGKYSGFCHIASVYGSVPFETFEDSSNAILSAFR